MDDIPVEVIGNILSRLGDARDIVIASVTCRKWREAYRKHLHTLSFNSVKWPSYKWSTSRSTMETFITQTIFQTKGLQRLSIQLGSCNSFSSASVLAWLLYARETLLELRINVPINPRVNILEICGRNKLEVIELAYNSIGAVGPKFQRFPCLKSLSLRYVSVSSALYLDLLLSACPKIESLELIYPRIAKFDVHRTVELSSPTLKSIFVELVFLDKLIVEADCLEILHLKCCKLKDFELIGKGTLKQFKLDGVSIDHLYISENIESLEVVDISNFSIVWPIFLEMISKSSSVRKLLLWNSNVKLENGNSDSDEFEDTDEYSDEDLVTNQISTPQLNHYSVDLETIAVSFPKLSHLCLNYNLRDGTLNHSVQGSSYLINVTVLELGWTVLTDVFSEWVESLLMRCPNLKRLVIHGVISDARGQDKCNTLANFNMSMVRLMRSYMHVEVKFEFK
ncbi:unnamed protein product [Rhodiola kirilowii]